MLAITNPIGNLAIFAGLTGSKSPEEKKHTALVAGAAILVILLLVTWSGELILKAFGISVPRTFLKNILLCMVNSKHEISAEKAANYWLYNNHDQREKLNNIGIKSARPLIAQFRKALQPIQHYFCNGSETGLRLMNLDSRKH